MVSLSVIFDFPILQIADAITCENLLQPDDPRITQLLATHYDNSKRYNLRLFSPTRVQVKQQSALFYRYS